MATTNGAAKGDTGKWLNSVTEESLMKIITGKNSFLERCNGIVYISRSRVTLKRIQWIIQLWDPNNPIVKDENKHTSTHWRLKERGGEAVPEEEDISDTHVSQFRSVAGDNPRVPIVICSVLLKSPWALYTKHPAISMAEWITTSSPKKKTPPRAFNVIKLILCRARTY